MPIESLQQGHQLQLHHGRISGVTCVLDCDVPNHQVKRVPPLSTRAAVERE